MRSLLNNLSTVEIVLVFVSGAAAPAVAGVMFAERTLPRLRDGSLAFR